MIVGVAAAGAYVGARWWHQRAPYDPAVLAASATLEFVTYDVAQAAMDEGIHAAVPQPGRQHVLGRVTWRKPPKPLAGGWFEILVIDQRTHTKPVSFSVSSPRVDAVSIGSDFVLYDVERKYAWLRGAGPIQVGDSWRDNGDSLSVSDEAASPVTFVALFPVAPEHSPPGGLGWATAPVAVSDLLVAMVHIGPDRQVYWAQRLL